MNKSKLNDYPEFLNDYWFNLVVAKGKSERTVEGYLIDIRTFLRYLIYIDSTDDIEFNMISIKKFDVNNLEQVNLKKIYEDVHKRIIGKSIIRKNWIIDLQYSIENIDNEQVIKEKIIWEYEINNITKNNVDFPLSIIQIQNDVNHLFTFSTVDELGKRKIIFDNNTVNEIYNINGIRKNQKNIIIEPYKNYYVHLDFEFLHYVSKLKPFIHNSLAPTQTTFGITLKVTLPENYNFSLLGIDGISPLKCEQFDNHKILNYKIPYILFPEQIIEYVVRKEDKYE